MCKCLIKIDPPYVYLCAFRVCNIYPRNVMRFNTTLHIMGEVYIFILMCSFDIIDIPFDTSLPNSKLCIKIIVHRLYFLKFLLITKEIKKCHLL